MAIRGKVKSIKIESIPSSFIGPDGTPTTVINNIASGTVTDTTAKKDYPFVQPLGQELGLAINSIVQFEIGTLSDGSSVGCSLDPVEKGKIDVIDPIAGTGILTDKAGNKINFEQNYGTELGLTAGAVVRFATVTVNGTVKATALKLAGN